MKATDSFKVDSLFVENVFESLKWQGRVNDVTLPPDILRQHRLAMIDAFKLLKMCPESKLTFKLMSDAVFVYYLATSSLKLPKHTSVPTQMSQKVKEIQGFREIIEHSCQ